MEVLLKNPKFWVALVSLVALIVVQFIPSYAIDTEQAAGMFVVLVAYLYGVIKDPGGPAWRDMLRSRKFWAALIGVVVLFLSSFNIKLPAGITVDQVVEVVVAIATSLILSVAHIRGDNPPYGVRGVRQ